MIYSRLVKGYTLTKNLCVSMCNYVYVYSIYYKYANKFINYVYLHFIKYY